MHIRTFRASSLQEALEQIRVQMGPDASVLHTRQIRDGWLGWLGRTYVEVTAGSKDSSVTAASGMNLREGSSCMSASDHETAAVENGGTVGQIAAAESGQQPNFDSGPQPIVHLSRTTVTNTNASSNPSFSDRPKFSTQSDSVLNHRFIEPGNRIYSNTNSSFTHSGTATTGSGLANNGGRLGLPEPLETYRTELLAMGVRNEVANRWLTATASFAAAAAAGSGQSIAGTAWMDHLRRSVARELRIGSPIRTQPGDRRVVALVGPTGVGKTTTVAKLAAGFRIEARRRVGLLTIDTFRIAAVEQLRAYADIMDLPMEVVEREHEMQDAMQRLGDVDLVLIDTAGRSPGSDARIEQLMGLLRAAQPDETHLVLSSTASRASIELTLAGFAPVSPTSVILTKLDETPNLAGPLSALIGPPISSGLSFDGGPLMPIPNDIPLSYITNGQQVPDDISVADTDALMQRLMPTQLAMSEVRAA